MKKKWFSFLCLAFLLELMIVNTSVLFYFENFEKRVICPCVSAVLQAPVSLPN